MTTQVTTPINISEAGDKSVGTGPFDVVALDSNSNLPSSLFDVYTYTAAYASTALLTSTQDLTVSINVGFIPKRFKAFICQDIAGSTTWSYGSNANIARLTAAIEGKVGGPIISWCGSTYQPSNIPSSYSPIVPYETYEHAAALAVTNAFYTGTMASPGIPTTWSPVVASSFVLSSISLAGTTLTFTFSFNRGACDAGVRYGVSYLVAEK